MTTHLDSGPAPFAGANDEDTIALDLSADEMRALYVAAAASTVHEAKVPPADESTPRMPCPPEGAARPKRLLHRPSAAVSIGVASGLAILSGIAWLGTNPAPLIPVDLESTTVLAATATPADPPADRATVQYANPFDATEVFEFPAGTSEIEARNAVADLLLQRARDRRDSWSKTARDSRKPASRMKQQLSSTALNRRS